MMNLMRHLCIFIACVMSFAVSAAQNQQCTFNTESGFDFTVSLTASEHKNLVEIKAKNVGNGFEYPKPIWSNRDKNSPYIVDKKLDDNTDYTLGFTFEWTNGSSTNPSIADGNISYYRKAEGQEWKLISADNHVRIGVNTELSINHGELNCDGSPTEVTPTPLPDDFDVCDYFPGYLQTNSYANGKPFGSLMIQPGTTIIIPDDDYKMSFGSSQGNGTCQYPSGPDDCKYDQTPIDGYPLPLSDYVADGNLTIPAGTTHTLESGEYWLDTLTFGGDNARLEINGKVILHYKKFVVPETGYATNFYINQGGNVGDLVIIGHGSASSIQINPSTSATMHAVANFYVEPVAGGFSIAGFGTYIQGSISAANVSISGNVDLSGEGTCVATTPSEPEIDVCDYFPEPAQSWKSGSSLNIQNAHQKLIGWSDGYISDHLFKANEASDGTAGSVTSVQCTAGDSDCALEVGFDTVSYNGKLLENLACEDGACIQGGEKITTPPAITPSFTSTVDITVDSWADKGQCVVNGETYCTVVGDGTGTYTITILKSLRSLTVNAWNDDQFNIVFQTDPDDAKYGLKIETVLLAGKTTSLVALFVGDPDPSGDARFTFGQATITSGQITTTGQTLLFLTQGLEVTNPFKTALNNPNSDFLIYGPEATVNFAGDGQEMRLKVLADSVTFHNSAAIYGAVTANELNLSESNTYIIADEGLCSTTDVDDNYAITITPEIDYSLMCGDDQPTFTVTTQKNGEAASLGVNAEILPSANSDDFDVQVMDGVGSGGFPNFLSDSDGHLELGITIKNPANVELNKEYTLKVELVSDTSLTANGKFIYIPFKFKADDQFVIAGKSQAVNVEVVGCSDSSGTETLITNYSGKPDVSYNLNQPSSGVGSLSFAPELKDGVTTTATQDLTFDNSGVVDVTLEDTDFDCTGLSDCPIEGNGTLKGNFVVKARPWTFAICHPNKLDMDGDANGGPGFIAAGDAFNLQVKPIVWQTGGSETAPVDVSSYCSADVTSNFFITQAPSATVTTTSELATPLNGRLNGGLTSVDGLLRQHDEINSPGDDYYTYSNLIWEEVGSLKVNADTMADYLGMDINLGYRKIGRFYPHHLTLELNDWDYADDHHGFAYMDQPIGVEYIVEAKSKNESLTWNYGLFDSDLQDKLGLLAVNTDNNQSLSSRLFYTNQATNGWTDVLTGGAISDRNGQYLVNYDDFKFLKKLSTNPNNTDYTTTPDGPYDSNNALFGVAVTDEVDGVDFDFDTISPDEQMTVGSDTGVSFISQPDFRYGRMALDSIRAEQAGYSQVPLRTEYWDGTSYIQNTDDDGSQFKTIEYCTLSNVSNPPVLETRLTDTVDTNTAHNVDAGTSTIVRALQLVKQKEIARIFLRQGITQPEGTNCSWNAGDQPWLQFNWRDYGDEDPSAVIVFGADRGNDRVIYRGEPNLTGN